MRNVVVSGVLLRTIAERWTRALPGRTWRHGADLGDKRRRTRGQFVSAGAGRPGLKDWIRQAQHSDQS